MNLMNSSMQLAKETITEIELYLSLSPLWRSVYLQIVSAKNDLNADITEVMSSECQNPSAHLSWVSFGLYRVPT